MRSIPREAGRADIDPAIKAAQPIGRAASLINEAVPRSVDVFLRGYGMPVHLGIAEPKREAA
jgi:hypothetical protein